MRSLTENSYRAAAPHPQQRSHLSRLLRTLWQTLPIQFVMIVVIAMILVKGNHSPVCGHMRPTGVIC